MYYDTAPIARLDKPAREAVIDLINKHNSTFFEYGELNLIQFDVLPAVPESQRWIAANTEVHVSQAGVEASPVAVLRYHRLDLDRYLGPGPLYFVGTPAEVLANVQQFMDDEMHVQMAQEEIILEFDPEMQNDESYIVTLRAVENNPVWQGQLELRMVEDDTHLGRLFTRLWFTRLRLEDLTTN